MTGPLAGVLAAPALELHEKESIVEGGRVKGAIMPWIDDLDFGALEKEPLLSAWISRISSVSSRLATDRRLSGRPRQA